MLDAGWMTLCFDGPPLASGVVHEEPGIRFVKQAPGMVRDQSGRHTMPDLNVGPFKSLSRRIDCLRDVHLVWYDMFIRLGDGGCCTTFDSNPASYVAHVASYPGLAALVGLRHKDGALALDRIRLQAAQSIPGPVLFATVDEPNTWGGWLIHVLPAVLHYLAHRKHYRALMVSAEQPSMRALLRLLGITEAELILHDRSRAYRFEEVHILRQLCHNFVVFPETRDVLARLVHTVAGGTASPGSIYVSRRRRTVEQGAYRALTNEDALIEHLETQGFQIIDPEYLPVEEQIALFGRANRIVGLGGSGLFNCMFARPGTSLVTIDSMTAFLRAHTNMFASCGMRYGIILGEQDQADPEPLHKRWSLDVPAAAQTIAEFMSTVQPPQPVPTV